MIGSSEAIATNTPILEIDAVRKTFPPARGVARLIMRTASDQPTEALRGVDLHVSRGEVVGLVGPNGAGKSTLFRIVATLLEPTTGGVRVDGHDTFTDPMEVRQRIGLALEGDRGFYQRLTGRQNLEFFGVMQGLSPTEVHGRAEELMTTFHLAHRDKRVFGYSAGMRLRLALARALLTDPPLLLLDEPTRSLDPAVSEEVLELIGHLAAGGRAVLMASHRLNEVTSACNRGVLLIDGVVHFDGPPTDLVTVQGKLRPLVDLVRDKP